jgi:hypothetical protein
MAAGTVHVTYIRLGKCCTHLVGVALRQGLVVVREGYKGPKGEGTYDSSMHKAHEATTAALSGLSQP